MAWHLLLSLIFLYLLKTNTIQYNVTAHNKMCFYGDVCHIINIRLGSWLQLGSSVDFAYILENLLFKLLAREPANFYEQNNNNKSIMMNEPYMFTWHFSSNIFRNNDILDCSMNLPVFHAWSLTHLIYCRKK